MKENGLFNPKQYCFVSGRSTVLQLLTILDTLTYEIDRGHHTDVYKIIHGLQKGLRYCPTQKTTK